MNGRNQWLTISTFLVSRRKSKQQKNTKDKGRKGQGKTDPEDGEQMGWPAIAPGEVPVLRQVAEDLSLDKEAPFEQAGIFTRSTQKFDDPVACPQVYPETNQADTPVKDRIINYFHAV